MNTVLDTNSKVWFYLMDKFLESNIDDTLKNDTSQRLFLKFHDF